VRVVFFVLLLANLAFLAWGGWVDTPRQAKTADDTARLPRLKLVSEAPVAKPQSSATSGTVQKMALTTPAGGSTAEAALNPPGPPPEVTRCVSVGPFNDVDVAAKAAGALKSRGFEPQQRAATGETWDGYWVYIAGVADAGAADRIFKTLDRSGIKDAHLMPESEGGRRISVGLFSDRDRADRRAKVVQRLGFKAAVDEHTQPGTVYWVDLAMKPSDGAVPVQDILALDSGNSRLSVQACPAAGPAAAPAGSPERSTPAEAAPPPGSKVPATTVAGTPKLP
jgi:hypothetical protein